MSRTLLILTLLALLAAPTAQAGLFDRDVVVTPAPERAGDRLAYDLFQSAHEVAPATKTTPAANATPATKADTESVSTSVGVAESRGQLVVEVEGPSRAVDAYGIERETVAYRLDHTREGELMMATRCHRLAGGVENVRADWLGPDGGLSWDQGASASGPVTLGYTSSGSVMPRTSFAPGSCIPGSVLAGVELREGDRLPIGNFLPRPQAREGMLSQPAVATEFEGRPALAFHFDIAALGGSGGEAVFVLADGLPGVAHKRISTDGERPFVDELRLVGYEPGDGAPLAPAGDARLPERNPSATFATPEPLAFDDAAFALPFPYADALAALRADPTARFSQWSTAHPDAVLVVALFDRDMRSSESTRTEGGWLLTFAEGSRAHTWTVVRVAGASTPLGPLDAPKPIDRIEDNGDSTISPPVAASPALADGASLARVTVAHGLAAESVRSLQYYVHDGSSATMRLSQAGIAQESEGATEGLDLSLDPTRGATLFVMEASYRSSGGLLSLEPPMGGVTAPRDGFAALAAPDTLAGGAAAAATGAGLLALLVKFLLMPLFTRLRRDKLLDNPVRARLYERVRAEPGIHRAELVDYAGIGEGATRHHLAQLVKHRLLVEAASDSFVRYFAAGEVPPDMARREAILRAGSHRAVYELYAREPHVSLRDAAGRLGLSAPSVHRAKKRLEAAGLLPAPSQAAVAEA